MFIGLLRFEFRLHGMNSLKTKRQFSGSLKQKIKNKFNAAVSEVSRQDSLDFLILAAVTVSSNRRRIESQLQKLLGMVEAISSEELVNVEMEIFPA